MTIPRMCENLMLNANIQLPSVNPFFGKFLFLFLIVADLVPQLQLEKYN
jgi:hypothetical protein